MRYQEVFKFFTSRWMGCLSKRNTRFTLSKCDTSSSSPPPPPPHSFLPLLLHIIIIIIIITNLRNDWNCEIVCGCKKVARYFIDLSTTL